MDTNGYLYGTGLPQRFMDAEGKLLPIYQAQLSSIVHSKVLAMDETPIKAGRKGHGKMKSG